jgi:hypothetical protein
MLTFKPVVKIVVAVLLFLMGAGLWPHGPESGLMTLGVAQCLAQGDDPVSNSNMNRVYSGIAQLLLNNQASPQGSLIATLADSGQGGAGIINIGQVAGSLNNQISLATGPLGQNQEVSNFLNYSGIIQTNSLSPGAGDYQVGLSRSFQSFTGIVMVSQLAGHLNNQFTCTSLLLGNTPSPGVTSAALTLLPDGAQASLTNAQLSAVAVNSGNQYNPEGPVTASVSLDPSSFLNFSGIANVNQVAGNLNTVVSNVTVTIKTVP